MLTAGDGVLWDRVKSDGVPVLRLAGLLRVAPALGVTDADWKPVLIPADRVRKLKKWRAACFTAWHAGRRSNTRVTVAVTCAVVGVVLVLAVVVCAVVSVIGLDQVVSGLLTSHDRHLWLVSSTGLAPCFPPQVCQAVL